MQHGTELAHVLGELVRVRPEINKHATVGRTGLVFFGVPELGAVVGKTNYMIKKGLEPSGVRAVGVD